MSDVTNTPDTPEPAPAPATETAEPTPADRVTELERQLAEERADRLRLKVATDKKLPPELASRLHGATEAELAADAETLLQFVRNNSGPGVPPASSASTIRRPITAMTPAEIREAFAKGQL